MQYSSLEELLDFLAPHMAELHGGDPEQMRAMLMQLLPGLEHWRDGRQEV